METSTPNSSTIANVRPAKSGKLAAIWGLTKQAFSQWSDDKAPKMAAALAYYTLFALAPLLILVIGLAGFFFQRDMAHQQIVSQLQAYLGSDTAHTVEDLLKSASSPTRGVWAAILSFATLFVASTAVFVELQDSLNSIWAIEADRNSGIKGFIRQRLLSFAMILAIGFLLIVSFVVSAVLAALTKFIGTYFGGTEDIWHIANFLISLGVVTALFAMIYKVLPDVKLGWKDVGLGAFVTAVLFTIGKTAIGFYIGRSSFMSVYGAAGSLVVLLVWVNYSAQIFFLGAEFTKVYAKLHGTHQSDAVLPVKDKFKPGLATAKITKVQSPVF